MRYISVIGTLVLSSMCHVIAVSAHGDDPSPSTRSLLTDIVVGQHVKVEGRTQRDGLFQAEQLTLRDSGTQAKVEGAISAISGDRRHLRMLEFDVVVDGATRLYRGTRRSASRSILTNGAWIEAKGTWQNGVLKATRIRVKELPEATEEIEGFIESVDAETATLTIMSRRVVYPPDLPILDERTGIKNATPADRLRRDDDDGQSRQPLAFGRVVLGGRLEGGYLDEQNFELGGHGADRTVLSRMQLLASSEITPTTEGYAKLTLAQNLTDGIPHRDARLSEAYILKHGLGRAPIDIQIGRQRFRDSREWMYDEYLDAARTFVTLPIVKVETAVSYGLLSGPEPVRRRRDQLQFIGAAHTRVRNAQISAVLIARHDTTRDERPIWFGGLVHGHASNGWTYWGDLALRRGHTSTERLAGWALDTGLTHRWPRRWSPAVTVAYAISSGDQVSGDGKNTRFRQTDLQDNQAYFGGLRRLAIYGELFDPELSNLHVLTAGFGVQPRRSVSIDVVYHRYAQAVASSSLVSGNLQGQLSGLARALGDEVNATVTFRSAAGLDVDLSTGVFVPGRAFLGSTTTAFFWRPQLRFYF